MIGLSEGVSTKFAAGKELFVRATTDGGEVTEFKVLCRLDTPTECDYYRHGGVLQYVLRQLVNG